MNLVYNIIQHYINKRGGSMKFTKMHGLGNDFIVIEAIKDGTDYNSLAKKMCDRHFGIGGDGILVVEESDTADSKMLIYNSDGSQAEMCGNGIRCFAKYLYDNGFVKKDIINIDTLDGIKKIEVETEGALVKRVKVNMGSPSFKPEAVPVNLDGDMVIGRNVNIEGEEYTITSMMMGVPHTVLFLDDIESIDIETVGKKIEHSKLFPKKTNVNFVKVIGPDEFIVRTWERGAGATLACGTGTCASLIACALNNKTGRKALAHLRSGELLIEWSDSGDVYMTGPAETVFTGEYEV